MLGYRRRGLRADAEKIRVFCLRIGNFVMSTPHLPPTHTDRLATLTVPTSNSLQRLLPSAKEEVRERRRQSPYCRASSCPGSSHAREPGMTSRNVRSRWSSAFQCRAPRVGQQDYALQFGCMRPRRLLLYCRWQSVTVELPYTTTTSKNITNARL
jgi:hypothetical protein